MLPCNVTVQEISDQMTEVAAIDPLASMRAIENPKHGGTAEQVRDKLKKVLENL
jgi:hypothetical protein